MKISNTSQTLALISFSLLVFSFITLAGLNFVVTERVGWTLMIALASLVPWLNLPGIEYHFASIMYTSITFAPPARRG